MSLDKLLVHSHSQKYVIFDTETEGLNLVSHRPWQLSWAIAKGKNIISEHDYAAKWPNINVSEGAAKVTGFNKSQYDKKAVDPVIVYEEFSKLLYDTSYVFVGHNILNFDIYMINTVQRLLGKEIMFPTDRCIDTKCLAIAVESNCPFEGKTPKDFMFWQYRVNTLPLKGLRINQEAMLKKLDIEYDQAKLHEALGDVRYTFEIMKKLLYKVDVPDFF